MLRFWSIFDDSCWGWGWVVLHYGQTQQKPSNKYGHVSIISSLIFQFAKALIATFKFKNYSKKIWSKIMQLNRKLWVKIMKNIFLFVGRFVLEFNHSAAQGALSSQLNCVGTYAITWVVESRTKHLKKFWTNLFHLGNATIVEFHQIL